MFEALVVALLFLHLDYGISRATASSDGDLFNNCSPSRCSEGGTEIRFPFRLATSTPSCGAPGLELACSREADTILLHPILGLCKVTAIDYILGGLNVIPLEESWTRCPLQKISTTNLSTSVYIPDSYGGETANLVRCSRELIPMEKAGTTPGMGDSIVGPISCLSNTSQFIYLMDGSEPMYILPLDCTVVSNGISTPWDYDIKPAVLFAERAKRVIAFGETTLTWSVPNITDICLDCERNGHPCGFSSQGRQAFCKRQGSRVKVIAATSSVATFVVLLLTAATALYRSLKSKVDEEVRLKIEMFLKAYGTSKPTRYTFSEVKKVTRRFKDKLGQGGFGSVYKGQLANVGMPNFGNCQILARDWLLANSCCQSHKKLPNVGNFCFCQMLAYQILAMPNVGSKPIMLGVPVAVKMLENSKSDGEEFMNEVATIGRIHHANVVRLLGFCSDGTRRALIYEFMPNGSLEKYIFAHDSDIYRELLAPNKMLEIASGIARGIEYLHQGCNQRILHFDIKPHNILLDYSFNPKISDFGLAKLCTRDHSIVTLTAARGTMGYIAPELYSRNFGRISSKSDVYSFGMLVLEMVSGRRNSDPWTENQNKVYIPEWTYEKISTEQELESSREMAQEEKDTVRKLAIVALWCIQWNPKNRPSMPKVSNMLTATLQSLTMPPKPFVSSPGHPMPQI
uniref:Receptor kinase n=1 Tax=Triticum aestivum TaxID=4565 RepID=A0A0B4SVG3_WHEAT|nr:receptor kinase [Triticum aestivum]